MYDQASVVREFVKWDYELRDGVQVAAVLDRAIDIAKTAPRGPVYLSLPREVLARDAYGAVPPRRSATPTDAYPSAGAVDRLADLLADASFPVFVTAASGADPGTAPLLGQLCDEFSIGLLESRPRCYNVSASHPLHIGYYLGAAASNADVLCFLDMDVPWIPAAAIPPADAIVVQCGPDPHYSRYRSARTVRTCRSPPASGTFSRRSRRPCPGGAAGSTGGGAPPSSEPPRTAVPGSENGWPQRAARTARSPKPS